MSQNDALTVESVRAFGVFARHRNFTAAARELHISQPSLHVKIRKLSESLKVPLYEKVGANLRLTLAGEQLARFAEDQRRTADDFVSTLTSAEAGTSVAIAAGRGTYLWVIGEALRDMIRAGHHLTLESGDRHTTIDHVRSGRVDIGIVAYDVPPPDLESLPIVDFPLVLAVPRRHKLARHASLTLADLAGLALAVPPAGRPHREALARALHDGDVPWTVAVEADGWDLMTQFVSLGLGCAVVNGCVRMPSGVVAVPIRDLMRVQYWATWRESRRVPATAALEFLRGSDRDD